MVYDMTNNTSLPARHAATAPANGTVLISAQGQRFRVTDNRFLGKRHEGIVTGRRIGTDGELRGANAHLVFATMSVEA